MDNELLDIFTHKLQSDIPLIRENIVRLKEEKEGPVANLFRSFHNYKASASYLGLKDFSLLVTQGEHILNALRTSADLPAEFDINWLSTCLAQLQTWSEELISGEKLSALNPVLFPTMTILEENTRTSEIMQGLSLLYADPNTQRAQKMKAPLAHIFKSVHTVNELNDIRSAVLNNSCDIIILNMLELSTSIAQELITIKPDIALVTAVPQLRTHQKSRLLIQGITHPIISPIQSGDLKRQLHNIVTSHFSKVYSLISHRKIYNFIQGLDPLSSSVKEITRLCDDADSSIKEIIKAVESDPITTANILHAASMPMYNVKNTSSIEQAVTSFGKRLVKALTLSDLAYKLGMLQLQAYNINEEQFKQTSRIRLALMNAWYSKVDSQYLNTLCSSSILGNLGQILINQEILNEELEEKFQAYGREELAKAEVSLLRTSSSFVTADILEFWNLDTELIDSIRYSDSPFNAGSTRLQQLSCANAVIYEMVTPYGELRESIPEKVRALMSKAGLEPEVLQDAIESLQQAQAD